jgi:DtxR family transcriptional regulator, Mn-dependent transcriptional regulator
MKERTSVVVEEYLLVIYSLRSQDKPVKAVDLARWIKSSASTVHATLSRMQRDSLITIGDRKEIRLTAEGLEKAEQLTRRHRLVESFLCDTLGISWHEVHEHAHVLEHGLTPLVEEKLAEFMGFPQTCPHGTPIPGADDHLPGDLMYLHQMPPGAIVEIVLVDEVLEEARDLMKFLQDSGIVPGQRHQVEERMEVTRNLSLISDTGTVTLPFEIAQKIGVIRTD